MEKDVSYDLIIMDYKMPFYSGVKAGKVIRRLYT